MPAACWWNWKARLIVVMIELAVPLWIVTERACAWKVRKLGHAKLLKEGGVLFTSLDRRCRRYLSIFLFLHKIYNFWAPYTLKHEQIFFINFLYHLNFFVFLASTMSQSTQQILRTRYIFCFDFFFICYLTNVCNSIPTSRSPSLTLLSHKLVRQLCCAFSNLYLL